MKSIVPARALPVVLCLLVGLLTASASFGGFEGLEQYIAATGNPVGGSGAQFDSTFWATNLGTSSLTFTFRFLKSGQANLSPASFSDTLAPGETKMYPSVIGTKLSLSNVNGAARITSSGPMLAGMRLFNQPSGVALAATAGQFFAGVPRIFSIGVGQTASVQAVYTGAGLDFRYNFVLVETSGASCTVHVRLLDNLGNELGSKDYALQPYEQIIDSTVSVAPAASTDNARIAATVTSGPGTALLAGSQVGNAGPQDQSAIDMSYSGALLGSSGGVTSLNSLTGDVTLSAGSGISLSNLGGNDIQINATGGGGGGLSSVAHNGTLAGDGTGGNPLTVAAPLNLSNGETTFTAAGPRIGMFASTTDTATSSFTPAIYGTANVVGVYGDATNGSGPQAWGELGRFFNSHYFGVLGFTFDSSAGVAAVYGDQNGGSGTTPTFPIGIWGDSHDGAGVFGTSSSTNSFAWYGVQGQGALGVEGIGTVAATNGGGTFSYGVEGDSYLVGDTRIGLFGYASGGTTTYAGYFVGNININGTSHTSGAVTIMDDPTDPENKYLYHSAVQSPDMKNIYDGVVTLDARGDAIVQLPAWFEALNRDYRYQVTCIGGFSPVWIEREVQGGQFAIKGEKPGQKVSWQLTGIRQDAWAIAHPVQVEVEKPPAERGFLLHPVEFGQSIEQGIEWHTNPQFKNAVEKQREAEARQAQEGKN